MSVAIPALRVGDPLFSSGLTVFPLFGDGSSNRTSEVEYCLADEALQGGAVIEEVSETGSVPDLLVDNRGNERILLLEGEELKGAKQNRILNTSVLVAANSKLKIPVSCVEQGRWRYTARHFQSSGHQVSAKLRRAVKASVGVSLDAGCGHRADQSKVWEEVEMLHSCISLDSPTSALSDAFDHCEDRIAESLDTLQYVEGAIGLAAAIGGRVVSADFFDKPATCEKVWPRLLSGMVFDALEEKDVKTPSSTKDVEQLLNSASSLTWHAVEAVGEGVEYRAESERHDHASALILNDVVVHGSILAGG
jgi:hypothetical protein